MTAPRYRGRWTCDACDKGSGATPTMVWQLDGVVIMPDGRSVADPVVCETCLARLGHERPAPRTAGDLPQLALLLSAASWLAARLVGLGIALLFGVWWVRWSPC